MFSEITACVRSSLREVQEAIDDFDLHCMGVCHTDPDDCGKLMGRVVDLLRPVQDLMKDPSAFVAQVTMLASLEYECRVLGRLEVEDAWVALHGIRYAVAQNMLLDGQYVPDRPENPWDTGQTSVLQP